MDTKAIKHRIRQLQQRTTQRAATIENYDRMNPEAAGTHKAVCEDIQRRELAELAGLKRAREVVARA